MELLPQHRDLEKGEREEQVEPQIGEAKEKKRRRKRKEEKKGNQDQEKKKKKGEERKETKVLII